MTLLLCAPLFGGWYSPLNLVTRYDKYEAGVKLYWVEEDMEGEWSKSKGTEKEQTMQYETEIAAENVAAEMGTGPMSFDGTVMQGHDFRNATVQGSIY